MPLNRNQDFMFEDTTTLTTNAKSLKGALNEVNASLAEKVSQNQLVYVNVKNPPAPYVACKGDGSTDDTTALNALFANFKYLYLPSGTYIVQYTTFTAGVRLLGDGYDKTIIKRINGFNVTTFDTTHPEKANLFGNASYNFSTKENVSIEGICFDGNVQNAVMSSSQGLSNIFANVQIAYLDNLFIKNCKFINSIGDGIYIGGVNNAIIDSCTFNHIGYNIASGSTSRNCISTFGMYYNGSANIVVESNTIIRSCFFTDSADMGIVTRNPKSLLIEYCDFRQIANSNLELYGDSQNTTHTNTFDTRMVIRNNIFSGANVTYGNPNQNYQEVFIFENNQFDSSSQSLTLNGTAGNGSNLTDFSVFIRNNKFNINQINISGIKYINLKDNTISYSNTTGVYFALCSYPLIEGNNFFYNGVSTGTTGLSFYNTITEPNVSNNVFSTNTASVGQAIYFSYTDNSTVVIQNLRIIGNKISGYNRGVNISSAVGGSLLINSNIFDIPLAGNYCIYQWSTTAATKAIATGNILLNNTGITLNATTKVTTGNV